MQIPFGTQEQIKLLLDNGYKKHLVVLDKKEPYGFITYVKKMANCRIQIQHCFNGKEGKAKKIIAGNVRILRDYFELPINIVAYPQLEILENLLD